jgi:serine O-acetyltransferase
VIVIGLFAMAILVVYWTISLRPNSYSYSYLRVLCERNKRKVSLASFFFLLLTDKGLLALLIYRVAHRIDSPIVGKLLSRVAEFLTGIEIYYNARIGKGVEIWHGNGVVIGQSAVVGDNTLILQQVTLGGGFVKVGSRCKLGAGAKLLGNIELGDDVVVAANAVVTNSFNGNLFVGGIPARVISAIDSSAEVVFGTKERNT